MTIGGRRTLFVVDESGPIITDLNYNNLNENESRGLFLHIQLFKGVMFCTLLNHWINI